MKRHADAARAPSVVPNFGCRMFTLLDAASVESEIKAKLEQQLSGVTVEIECPDDIEAKAGAGFDCIASSEGDNKRRIAVTQTDDDGSIDFRVDELLDQ
jgi:Domain of unknown function (DUF4333)